MSFKKLQIISPFDISSPEEGHVYFGRDSLGYWEKKPNGNIEYITTGSTSGSGTSGSSGTSGISNGTSGTSGSSGISGTSGTNGTSGSSGTSGRDGNSSTSGTSGSSGFTGTSGSSGLTGTSGTSGFTGSSGTSGFTGSSGTSGVNGTFFGTSGSSGYSGGYGGATRKWIGSHSSPSDGGFYGSPSPYNFVSLNNILINKKDADNEFLTNWLSTWTYGLLKIENINDLTNFGIYQLNFAPTVAGNSYSFTNFTVLAGNGSIINGEQYLISYVQNENRFSNLQSDPGTTVSPLAPSSMYWMMVGMVDFNFNDAIYKIPLYSSI